VRFFQGLTELEKAARRHGELELLVQRLLLALDHDDDDEIRAVLLELDKRYPLEAAA
jgi:hypothetical protein